MRVRRVLGWVVGVVFVCTAWSAPRAGERWRPPKLLGIAVADLPAPHVCRVWRPGEPSGEQAASLPCDEAWSRAGPGAWILDRTDRDHVRVYAVGGAPGQVAGVAVYDALRGKLLRELPP